MQIEDVTRLGAAILEATFFEIACTVQEHINAIFSQRACLDASTSDIRVISIYSRRA